MVRRARDRHDMSVAWIAYADFLASMAVVFFALYLGRRPEMKVVLDNPPAGQVRVFLGDREAIKDKEGNYYRLQIEQPSGDSVRVPLRIKVQDEPAVPVWATIRKNAKEVRVDYRSRDQVVLELNDSQPNFETGTAVLQDGARQQLRDKVLDQCASDGKYPFLRQNERNTSTQMLMVCGYADGQRFASQGTGVDPNWRLSYERALAVREYLVRTGGCDPDRIMVAAFGSFQQQESESGLTGSALTAAQRRNRRVELRIVTDGSSIGAQPDRWTSRNAR